MPPIKHIRTLFQKALSVQVGFFLFVFPASTNYQLESYGFGGGGEENMTSTDYGMNAISGEQSEDQLSGTNYNLGPGLVFTEQANVPQAPTFTNPSNYYNKLHLVLSTGSNPTDTTFAIAISDDNWVTTKYVQSDNTVGTVLGSEDRQTYTAWGGASGFDIIGLASSTTYKVKVKAMQGRFTETGYGPEASVATVGPQLTFSITTDTQPTPPFSIDFGSMTPNSVNTSPHQVNVALDTNAENGGHVYVSGTNSGLYSSISNHKIDAVSGNLTALSEGFGAQGISATQTSGGPFSIASLYNQGGDIVGITDQTIRSIFDSAGPVVGGAGSFILKAKPLSTAPSASDYAETLTVIASASF